jgi:demethylsterigmatocystin 6-O-methyltransferase
LIGALADDSLILIDDMVLPNKGAHWHTTQIDLLMMATLASRERTEEHWHKLLGSVGLKISNVYTYTDPLRDSIIEVIRA